MIIALASLTLSIPFNLKSGPVEVPEDLKLSLEQDKPVGLFFFENLSYTHRHEYVAWINEAKKSETRLRRIKKAVEML